MNEVNAMIKKCVWHYRPGTNDTHWAITSCNNTVYLSKVPSCKPYEGVADWYIGRICPKCGKQIEIMYGFR